jgi:hypothetical protein
MGSVEHITIQCPLCPYEHEYPLTVVRSVSFGVTGAPQELRGFVRLFICPTTSNQFEATLTLTESALDRIEELSVGAPSDKEEHG